MESPIATRRHPGAAAAEGDDSGDPDATAGADGVAGLGDGVGADDRLFDPQAISRSAMAAIAGAETALRFAFDECN
jgi:hypothetical protein